MPPCGAATPRSSITAGDAPVVAPVPASYTPEMSLPAAPVPVAYTSDTAMAAATPGLDAEVGLAGTVELYERHVFLCYEGPEMWPSGNEDDETNIIPGSLAAAIRARKSDMKKITEFTVCEGEGGLESSNGDVLIFPNMIRYKGLTRYDVDNFVEEVLVKDNVWLDRPREAMAGSYVFVCCHGGKEKRCHILGPALMLSIYDQIDAQHLDQVTVSACSHIGGDKDAGNIIIFSSDANGEVAGHWYGFILPCDVPFLMHQHIVKEKIMEHLWRGQMGLTKKQQLEKALRLGNITNGRSSAKIFLEETGIDGASCSGGFTCLPKEKQDESINQMNSGKENGKESSAGSKKGHTLALITAAISAFVAFRVYKNQLRSSKRKK